ncbi:hypothetical protein CYMTET_44384 [Cymbomonas tetramitiformis]|uniref:Uncharacterized protein n=1 Tax=Cymbomonas tetramitiformis TaxID=36881 RepID=A0AAE0EZN3_9CHLO|nr:hypothetical protein CYMTET_44386 [Cymbomonas tetramitiformis]KAK3246070.1 hypothetical protein CYMTET_44384 [Cymbomonas tetramitiformis]
MGDLPQSLTHSALLTLDHDAIDLSSYRQSNAKPPEDEDTENIYFTAHTSTDDADNATLCKLKSDVGVYMKHIKSASFNINDRHYAEFHSIIEHCYESLKQLQTRVNPSDAQEFGARDSKRRRRSGKSFAQPKGTGTPGS